MSPDSGKVMANYSVRRNSKSKLLTNDNRNLNRCTQLQNSSTVEKCRQEKEDSRSKFYQYFPILPEQDFAALNKSVEMLIESSWYFADFNSADAKAVLSKMDVGTFLVRNSSDPNYLFSLSVKTERGATSVRIRYVRGLFQFDCEDSIKHKLPRFENVVELVDFHVTLCKEDSTRYCRWLENSGRRDLAVKLKKPYLSSVPSLKHLSRLAINRTLKDLHIPQISSSRLPIPDTVKHYLQQYPYKV